jgi:hypothetical protein
MSTTILSDSYGNLITVSHFAISTGEKAGFYTLRAFGSRTRYTRTEHGTESESDDASVYIRNLSTDKAQALQAAREYLTEHYPTVPFRGVVNFDLDDIHRISREESERRAAAEAARIAATDFSVFQAGKYAGRPVAEVLAEDPQYVTWFADNSWHPDSDGARTAAIARELVAPIRQAAASAAQVKADLVIAAAGADLVTHWSTGLAGGFLESIAAGLREGKAPTGRGLDILIEIIAKHAGRRGSKAYNDAHDALTGQLA